jgi:hypothetical protein
MQNFFLLSCNEKSGFSKAALAIMSMVLLPGCDPSYHIPSINFNYGTVPDTVCNWQAINSEWDDMNMPAPPEIRNQGCLFFSTNRFTQGGTFDLAHVNCYMSFDQVNGEFNVETWWNPAKIGQGSIPKEMNSAR